MVPTRIPSNHVSTGVDMSYPALDPPLHVSDHDFRSLFRQIRAVQIPILTQGTRALTLIHVVTHTQFDKGNHRDSRDCCLNRDDEP